MSEFTKPYKNWGKSKNSDKIQTTNFRQKLRQQNSDNKIQTTKFRQNSDNKIQTNSDNKIQTTKFRQQKSDNKIQTKFRQHNSDNKIQTKSRQQNSDKNSDKVQTKIQTNQISDQNPDKDPDKIPAEIRVKFRHKSDRIPGLGIFGCSGSFEKVLFILRMKLQNSFCCFQKQLKFSSLFFFEDPFFFEDVLGSILLFYKDWRGPKKAQK